MSVTVNEKEQLPAEIKKHKPFEYIGSTCVKELRRFLGLAICFRGFLKDYAKKTVKSIEGLKGEN